MKIFRQLTPYLIICSFLIIYTAFYITSIFAWNKDEVVALPILFMLLLGSVAFLLLDRFALRKWEQKKLVIFELATVPLFILLVNFNNRKLIIEPAAGVQSFVVVDVEKKEEESTASRAFPFNRKIKIETDNQLVYLTKETQEKYNIDVSTKCNIYLNSRNETGRDNISRLMIFSLCEEPTDVEEIFDTVLEKIKNTK
ncbi:MAG: hypothetical protein AAFZ15_02205 [Bacteroidota bacterium]